MSAECTRRLNRDQRVGAGSVVCRQAPTAMPHRVVEPDERPNGQQGRHGLPRAGPAVDGVGLLAGWGPLGCDFEIAVAKVDHVFEVKTACACQWRDLASLAFLACRICAASLGSDAQLPDPGSACASFRPDCGRLERPERRVPRSWGLPRRAIAEAMFWDPIRVGSDTVSAGVAVAGSPEAAGPVVIVSLPLVSATMSCVGLATSAGRPVPWTLLCNLRETLPFKGCRTLSCVVCETSSCCVLWTPSYTMTAY